MKDKTNILYWISMLALIGYFAYIRGWILTDFESLSAKQGYQLLSSDQNSTWLDVRSTSEFDREHIKGSILIPLNLLEQRVAELEKFKTKKIIVYCHSGNRSVQASRILAKHGFVPINLNGGLIEWKREGYEVVK